MSLTQEPSDKTITGQLMRLLEAIEIQGHAILPRSNDELLQTIVDAAAKIFNAAAASILLVNEQENELEFKVTYGTSNQHLVGMKFPLDQGLAGYVVMTGQPLAISNVRQDPRFNQDFAKDTGYVPDSILAMPLLVADRVIGVMEVLDKVNALSFGIQDMELLGLFARQAALAIDQSRKMDQIENTLISGLKRIAKENAQQDSAELINLLDAIDQQYSDSDLLALADLFNDIAQLGEGERKVCIKILETFAEYHRSVRRTWR